MPAPRRLPPARSRPPRAPALARARPPRPPRRRRPPRPAAPASSAASAPPASAAAAPPARPAAGQPASAPPSSAATTPPPATTSTGSGVGTALSAVTSAAASVTSATAPQPANPTKGLGSGGSGSGLGQWRLGRVRRHLRGGAGRLDRHRAGSPGHQRASAAHVAPPSPPPPAAGPGRLHGHRRAGPAIGALAPVVFDRHQCADPGGFHQRWRARLRVSAATGPLPRSSPPPLARSGRTAGALATVVSTATGALGPVTACSGRSPER